MRVVAIPNPSFPPEEASLAEADVRSSSLDELVPELIDPTDRRQPFVDTERGQAP